VTAAPGRVADDRWAALSALIEACAAGREEPVSAAHVCAVAVSAAQVSGGWVAASSKGGPDFVMHVTDPVGEQLAELTLTLGQGPCHDMALSGAPVLAGDLGGDGARRRWPAFAPAALELGVAAVFSFPLSIGVIRAGVMGLYRNVPGPLSGRQLGDCFLLTDAATTLLLTGSARDHGAGDGTALYGQAPDLARHRQQVDQATGMLTVQLRVGVAEAFVRLRAHAYAQDRPLTDVARDIVARRLRFTPDRPSDGRPSST
jgi:hypothetical protein